MVANLLVWTCLVPEACAAWSCCLSLMCFGVVHYYMIAGTRLRYEKVAGKMVIVVMCGCRGR